MSLNTFSRWIVPTLLLAAGHVVPSPVAAQFSALRQATQPTGPVATPPVTSQSGLVSDANQPAQNSRGSSNLQALDPVLLFGIEEQYRGSTLKDGSYRLESKADESSIKFFYADNPTDTYGRRSIVTNLKIEGPGSAGLIYGYQKNPTRYFLFLLDANQNFRVLERGPDGFSEMINMSVDGDGGFELKLTESGSEVSVSLNGQNLLSIGNDRIGVGAVGIATIGAGQFDFQKFETSINHR